MVEQVIITALAHAQEEIRRLTALNEKLQAQVADLREENGILKEQQRQWQQQDAGNLGGGLCAAPCPLQGNEERDLIDGQEEGQEVEDEGHAPKGGKGGASAFQLERGTPKQHARGDSAPSPSARKRGCRRSGGGGGGSSSSPVTKGDSPAAHTRQATARTQGGKPSATQRAASAGRSPPLPSPGLARGRSRLMSRRDPSPSCTARSPSSSSASRSPPPRKQMAAKQRKGNVARKFCLGGPEDDEEDYEWDEENSSFIAPDDDEEEKGGEEEEEDTGESSAEEGEEDSCEEEQPEKKRRRLCRSQAARTASTAAAAPSRALAAQRNNPRGPSQQGSQQVLPGSGSGPRRQEGGGGSGAHRYSLRERPSQAQGMSVWELAQLRRQAWASGRAAAGTGAGGGGDDTPAPLSRLRRGTQGLVGGVGRKGQGREGSSGSNRQLEDEGVQGLVGGVEGEGKRGRSGREAEVVSAGEGSEGNVGDSDSDRQLEDEEDRGSDMEGFLNDEGDQLPSETVRWLLVKAGVRSGRSDPLADFMCFIEHEVREILSPGSGGKPHFQAVVRSIMDPLDSLRNNVVSFHWVTSEEKTRLVSNLKEMPGLTISQIPSHYSDLGREDGDDDEGVGEYEWFSQIPHAEGCEKLTGSCCICNSSRSHKLYPIVLHSTPGFGRPSLDNSTCLLYEAGSGCLENIKIFFALSHYRSRLAAGLKRKLAELAECNRWPPGTTASTALRALTEREKYLKFLLVNYKKLYSASSQWNTKNRKGKHVEGIGNKVLRILQELHLDPEGRQEVPSFVDDLAAELDSPGSSSMGVLRSRGESEEGPGSLEGGDSGAEGSRQAGGEVEVGAERGGGREGEEGPGSLEEAATLQQNPDAGGGSGAEGGAEGEEGLVIRRPGR